MRYPTTFVADISARAESLTPELRRHRVVIHLTVVAMLLALVTGLALPPLQAGLALISRPSHSVRPADIGSGVLTTEPVVMTFAQPMDTDAVLAALEIHPLAAIRAAWSADLKTLTIQPVDRWAADQRYLLTIPAGTNTARGYALGRATRAAFTTQPAPWVTAFVVNLAGPEEISKEPLAAEVGGSSAASFDQSVDETWTDASAGTAISLTFSVAMDQASVAEAFRISPAIPGDLEWNGTTVRFRPATRLAGDTRYAVSLAGARDADGNLLGGDTSFSFVTRPTAAIIAVSPAKGSRGVSGDTIAIEFSQPMATELSAAAFALTDLATGRTVPGTISWNADGTTLTFTANRAFAHGHRFRAVLGEGALDADGNPVAIDWTFATASVAARSYVAVNPPPMPAGTSAMQAYALDQINAARASYGFGPVALDPAISAVAYAHSYDELVNGYFAHDSLDGTKFYQRLSAAGISWTWSGENGCWRTNGGNVQDALKWCHAGFMAEPYPGYANHIANILHPKAKRVGIGIATDGNRVFITWDYTN